MVILTEKVSDGKLHQHKLEDSAILVYSYPELASDVVERLFILAKGIKKNIVVADWTSETIDKDIKNFSNAQDFFILYITNPTKDIKNEKSLLPISIGGNKIEVISLAKQFKSYADEWHLFDKIPETFITSEDGVSLGKATKNYCRFFIDLIDTSIFDRKMVMDLFVSQLMSLYNNLPDESYYKVIEWTKGFTSFMKYGIENLKAQVKHALRSKQREMTDHYSAIQRLEREIEDDNRKFRSVGKKMSGFNAKYPSDKLQEMFAGFLKQKWYTEIEFGDTYIVAYTDKIYIENYGAKYYIGKFKVTIKLDGTVRFQNEDNPYESDTDHPHVSGGIPCLGNIKTIIPKMINDGDFLGLLTICHQFLTTYNEEGPYTPVERGWGDEDDWCGRCDRPAGNCSCSYCEYCDEHTNDCTCDKCPRYGTVMEEVCCDECEHWRHNEDDEDSEYMCRY